MIDIDRVRTLRLTYWSNGYRPIAIWSPGACDRTGQPVAGAGKRPHGDDWRLRALKDPPDAVAGAVSNLALNTGILGREVVGVDVDVPALWLVDSVVHRIEHMLGPTPLTRVGQAPKMLLVYRVEQPIAKLMTPSLFLPDGTKVQVEILGDGQQFVCDGIHPDTGQPYHWTDASPADVAIEELPIVDAAMLRDMLDEVEHLLRDAGAVEKEKPAPKPPPRQKASSSQEGSDFFRNVNSAALANVEAWVRQLFPKAKRQPATGAWRISSESLGRDLEEDISIHPDGIWDYGLEVSQTAIDLVLAHGGVADATAAALWLCEQLGAKPESLGWRAKAPPPHPGNGRDPDPPVAPPLPPGPEPAPPAGADEGVRLEDFHAYMEQHNYIFTPSRAPWPAASVNARIPPIDVGVDKEGKPIRIKASTWLDQNRPVEQMTWAPGLPMIIRHRLISEGGWIRRNGVSCLNLYRPPTIIAGDPEKAEPWLDHVKRIYPEDAPHIIRWSAQRVQHPEDKINHALVLGGAQGIGKDSLIEPVKRAVGPWNVKEIWPAHLTGPFNGFVKSVILRISEAHDLGDIDRYQFYEHTKAYTSAPPDVLPCNEKHLREHAILNCCGVVITTNHKTDGLFLPADDRRHYVAWSFLAKEDFTQNYWDKLWGWYAAGGDRHVAAYLAQLDLSDFNPKAPPPKTAAFWDIVNASRSPEDAELADALDRLSDGNSTPDAVTVANVVGKASTEFAEWLNERKNRRVVPHRFEACGYVPFRNPDANDGLWKITGRRVVVYTKASLTFHQQLAAARRLVAGQ